MGNKNRESTARFAPDFDKRLAAYAVAAATACCGFLGVPTTVEATIVYVKNVNIRLDGSIDLNGDNVPDLFFRHVSYSTGGFGGIAKLSIQNSQIGASHNGITGPLQFGAKIGASRGFFGDQQMAFAAYLCQGTHCSHFQGGSWAFNGSAYMGIDFAIDGQPHFGWGKIDMFIGLDSTSATMVSYAYETLPGVGVFAGQTSDTPEPGTLALLALGAAGLETLRRMQRRAAQRFKARPNS